MQVNDSKLQWLGVYVKIWIQAKLKMEKEMNKYKVRTEAQPERQSRMD
jgi:hypothetical protein